MKKLSVILAMACLAVITYLAWNWVNQVPEPGNFQPQQDAGRADQVDKPGLSSPSSHPHRGHHPATQSNP